jgi:hypothetical protein
MGGDLDGDKMAHRGCALEGLKKMSRRELVRVQKTQSEDKEGGTRKKPTHDRWWNGRGHCGCSHVTGDRV